MVIKHKFWLALLLLSGVAAGSPSAFSDKTPKIDMSNARNPDGLDRNQTMLMNLRTGPRSAGYYILHSVRTADETMQDLEKAMRQIDAVDASYAKSRNRPDDRYLSTTSLKLTAARQTADQLHSQLEDCWSELKESIKETITTDPHFKP